MNYTNKAMARRDGPHCYFAKFYKDYTNFFYFFIFLFFFLWLYNFFKFDFNSQPFSGLRFSSHKKMDENRLIKQLIIYFILFYLSAFHVWYDLHIVHFELSCGLKLAAVLVWLHCFIVIYNTSQFWSNYEL